MPRAIHEFFDQASQQIASVVQEAKIVGEPLYLSNDEISIPISKVSFGFGTGGAEYITKKMEKPSLLEEENQIQHPFGGGSVGGVAIIPEAFLYIVDHECTIVWMNKNKNVYEKALDIFLLALKKAERKKNK